MIIQKLVAVKKKSVHSAVFYHALIVIPAFSGNALQGIVTNLIEAEHILVAPCVQLVGIHNAPMQIGLYLGSRLHGAGKGAQMLPQVIHPIPILQLLFVIALSETRGLSQCSQWYFGDAECPVLKNGI